MFQGNIGICLQVHIARLPRRPTLSSSSLPSEPQISLIRDRRPVAVVLRSLWNLDSIVIMKLNVVCSRAACHLWEQWAWSNAGKIWPTCWVCQALEIHQPCHTLLLTTTTTITTTILVDQAVHTHLTVHVEYCYTMLHLRLP
jgi:hypothetical protein